MNSKHVRIDLAGHPDDLYALALLFGEGSRPDLAVHAEITGAKDGPFDRVIDAASVETYITGPACGLVTELHSIEEAYWAAVEIIAPLNGYATLADSNFVPATPKSVHWKESGQQGSIVFGSSERPRSRLITANRTQLTEELRDSRVDFMRANPLAAYAAAVIAGPPSWAGYYRLLEDIAADCDKTLDKLHELGFVSRRQLREFSKAANNRMAGRHGASKRDQSLSEAELMNLLEARELVRNFTSAWFDQRCGGRMPRDRVDGPTLRFGLDDRS